MQCKALYEVSKKCTQCTSLFSLMLLDYLYSSVSVQICGVSGVVVVRFVAVVEVIAVKLLIGNVTV